MYAEVSRVSGNSRRSISKVVDSDMLGNLWGTRSCLTVRLKYVLNVLLPCLISSFGFEHNLGMGFPFTIECRPQIFDLGWKVRKSMCHLVSRLYCGA